MAYTPLLGLSLPADGTTNWGTLVNTSITALLDSAVAGTTTLSTDANVTLSDTNEATNQSRQAIILWTAIGTVTRTITAPAKSKTYVVINATGGTQSIVFNATGPTTGVTIPAGKVYMLAWNGTDFVTTGGVYGQATVSVDGLIKLGDATVQSVAANAVTATTSRTYALQVNSSGQGVINVPWTDTTYTLPSATDTVLGGIKLGSATQQTTAANAVTATASRTYALQVNASGQGLVNVPWTDTTYTLPTATDSVLGGIKLGDATVQSVAANAVSTTASRTYAVQLTSTGNAVVNVPWTAGGANNPGGSNTQVQYNNAGAFGGSANFTFDGQRVTVYGLTVSSAVFRSSDASIVSASTITPPADSVNQYNVTALAVPATIAAPSGTPVNGQKLLIRLKDDGTARALTWNAAYSEVGAILPTTTVATKITYVGCVYNSADAVWDVVAVTTQA